MKKDVVLHTPELIIELIKQYMNSFTDNDLDKIDFLVWSEIESRAYGSGDLTDEVEEGEEELIDIEFIDDDEEDKDE